MDEDELLKENTNLALTPLQTILLSESVVFVGRMLNFLVDKGLVRATMTIPDKPIDDAEGSQLGRILLESSITSLLDLSKKIWEAGNKSFGNMVPSEHDNIIVVLSSVLDKMFDLISKFDQQ